MKFNDLITESGFVQKNHNVQEYNEFKKTLEDLMVAAKNFSTQEKQALNIVLLKLVNDTFSK